MASSEYETKDIATTVSIHPKDINGSILDTVYKSIKHNHENICNSEYGFIKQILSITRIYNNIISSTNHHILFRVNYKALTFLPSVGKQATALVCMVFENGILLNTHFNMKILVPIRNLKAYKFADNKFVSESRSISVGDNIRVELLKTEYKNYSFNCIAKIIE